MREIIHLWLSDSGFSVSHPSLETGHISMTALRGREKWQIIIKPVSPLASSVSAAYSLNGTPDQDRIEELWSYLDNYSGGPDSEKISSRQDIPPLIMSKTDSVVCLKAEKNGAPFQFTGFFIDSKGTILSIAHDLEDITILTVVFSEGREQKARLIRMDPQRDLSLITLDSTGNSFISVDDGQDVATINESVYIIGCPLSEHKKVISGSIDAPMRVSNDQPLWQINSRIQPGSSGSPAFNSRGDLLGVVKGRFRGTDSWGFIIPVTTIKAFLKTD